MKVKQSLTLFIVSWALLLVQATALFAKTLKKYTEVQRSYAAKSLEDLIGELLEYNPELKSLVADINATQDFIPQASALEDPRLSFEFSHMPISNPSLNRTPMSGLQIYLRQKIPFPGKRGLRKKIAENMKDQAVEIHLEKINQLVAKFKMLYYDYIYVNRAIWITEKTHSRLMAVTKSLESRYAANQIPQQDVLQTKLESSQVLNRLIQLRKRRQILLSRLNALLVRPAGTTLKLRSENHRLNQLKMSLDQLRSYAKANRPWFNKTDKEIQKAKFQHRLAKKDLLPDFDFSAGYRFRDNELSDPVRGEDFFSAGVSINIPIWSAKKQNKHISETRHKIQSAIYKKAALDLELSKQVETLYFQVQQFREQYNLFRSKIVPQNQAALSSSQKSYEVGDIEYINVINNEINLLKNKLMMEKYFFDHQKKIAEIEMSIGKAIVK